MSLEARQILILMQQPLDEQRLADVEHVLRQAGDSGSLALLRVRVGLLQCTRCHRVSRYQLVDDEGPMTEMIMHFFNHRESVLRSNALEVYVRRLYRHYAVDWLSIVDSVDVDGDDTARSSGERWLLAAQLCFHVGDVAARPVGMSSIDSCERGV